MIRRRLLTAFTLVIGIANIARGVLAISIKTTFASYDLSISMPVLGSLYVLLGVAFSFFGVLFWKELALSWPIPIALIYQIVLWVLRILTYRSAYARTLWPRDAIMSVLFLLIVIILSVRRQQTA